MSAHWRILKNATTGEVILPRVKLCVSHWCHFRGLQFVTNLPEDQGLLFVRPKADIVNTTIHMFFMFMSIAVIWMDADGKVVDKKLAKPWRPMYAPKTPAMYFLETNTFILDRVNEGDMLAFDEPSET